MTTSQVFEDAREYIFPVFSVEAEGDGIHLNSRIFLGTAFFVSKKGDAISAGHVFPLPERLQEAGRRLIAIVLHENKETPCWITHIAKFDAVDMALLHVNLDNTKYLPVSAHEILTGTDVQITGIPDHELNMSGKEMRILKGHVTLAWKRLELNFPVPAGMSGSPVFAGTKVVGYATGQVRSEELAETTESVEEVSSTKEIIRITEIKRISYYGIAYAFHSQANHRDAILNNKTLSEFIDSQNA